MASFDDDWLIVGSGQRVCPAPRREGLPRCGAGVRASLPRRGLRQDPYSVETEAAASGALLRCCPRAKLSLILGWFLLAFHAPAAVADSADAPVGTHPSDTSRPEKFERAVVFSGGGLNIFRYLGWLKGIEAGGKPADVMIGTCGGSLAIAVANALPDHQDRLDFVLSHEFFRLFNSAGIRNEEKFWNPSNVLNLLFFFLGKLWVQGELRMFPDIFHWYILDLPQDYSLPELDIPFNRDRRRISSLIVAARPTFGPEDVGLTTSRGRHRYREVYFTDPETAKLLEGFDTPTARVNTWLRKSRVLAATEVIVDATVTQAARASIADPYLVNPAEIDGDYFITGAIDLHPLELAYEIADEVVMNYSPPFSRSIEIQGIYDTFGFDANYRLRMVHDSHADYWVDNTFADDEDELFIETVRVDNPLRMFLGDIHWLNFGFTDYEQYRQIVLRDWMLGVRRGYEAVTRGERNAKSHIRKMERANTSRQQRRRFD
jgi:hypothetical protein